MYKKLFCILYSDKNLFKQIYRLSACARANLVSGINKSNKGACAIYLILDKIISISPESCHYITREQAYSGNEIDSTLACVPGVYVLAENKRLQ